MNELPSVKIIVASNGYIATSNNQPAETSVTCVYKNEQALLEAVTSWLKCHTPLTPQLKSDS